MTAQGLLAAAFLGLCLLTLNVGIILLFRHDKDQAIARARRVPENTLLTLALLGGSPGAKWAQKRFRHKTRKQPFAATLNLICLLHIGLLTYGTAWAAGIAPPLTKLMG